ncbi:MAG: type III-B CRISPR module RAMP protein Cmr4 [Candidatus Eisenbacteria bacterium]|nr:type III-B CRISPR module RAMP protein Cmr4 [Candidatus Eisenbacteria bacterium]
MNKPAPTTAPPAPPYESALLFIYTETPLHVGSGAGLGAIDLPIQRERMSDLPVAPGSGLKGALREGFPRTGNNDEAIHLFGPEPPKKGTDTSEPDHAGALVLTDARLLLFPIRTVYGGWAWATCPMILERLARDLEIAGWTRPTWADLAPDPDSTSALIFADKPPIAPDGKNLLLEDTLYSARRAPAPAGDALVDFFRQALPSATSYDPTKKRLAAQLVLLTDEELKHWARRGTEVTTRVRIDDETGAVAQGALWTEEALPAESLLWSLAQISGSRKPKNGTEAPKAATLLSAFSNHLRERPRTFLGGDRTIGRGLCGFHLVTKKGAA